MYLGLDPYGPALPASEPVCTLTFKGSVPSGTPLENIDCTQVTGTLVGTSCIIGLVASTSTTLHHIGQYAELCIPEIINLGMGLWSEPHFLTERPEILTGGSWGELETIRFSRFRVWGSVRVLRALKFVAEVCRGGCRDRIANGTPATSGRSPWLSSCKFALFVTSALATVPGMHAHTCCLDVIPAQHSDRTLREQRTWQHERGSTPGPSASSR